MAVGDAGKGLARDIADDLVSGLISRDELS